ncbi:class I adenylate-forming enzyme family protein [Aeromicrobium wangtongii]|uniref:class I adenylate-forming enzyme family protein n=1 Tax=Aeromicrobium wangtongii TaxID=2969247 RepID=UPI002016F81C|nr:AMP-binding protein [Aeromicrobium wangtongii]MCL3819843.1 AMP-binding protein [Aeromicrobium wangtongii]
MSTRMRTMRDVLLRSRRFGERVAVRVGDEQRTYVQLIDRAARLARHLRMSGLEPGDRLAVMVEDGIRAVEPHLAAHLAGLVLVPVNARFRSAELDHILRDSGASGLVHSTGVSRIVDASDVAPGLFRIVTGGAASADIDSGYEQLLSTGPAAPPEITITGESLAMIGYTSGTTGAPKGAMMTHDAGMAALRANLVAFRVVPYGACAFSGSISFTALLWAFVYPHLAVGASIDFLQPDLTLDRWFDRMEQHGSTFTFVPTPYIDEFAQLAQCRPDAIARLAGVCHSASPATVDQRRAMVEALGPVYVESYGATETRAAGAAAATRPAGRGPRAPGGPATIGRPLAPADIIIVDEAGRPVPPGVTGEIVIDSPSLFVGYWDNPEATAAALPDGRYFTGDLGHLDDAGFVYVDGRRADLIISGGMNIYPAEVEGVLAGLDGVADVAVVGVPHERWGESVCAVVVRSAGAVMTAEDVIGRVQANLASYKKPTRVEFVDALPRNANLKVMKSVLRKSLG